MTFQNFLRTTFIALTASLNLAHAGFVIEVEGETPPGISPKLTVVRLTSTDSIQASSGVPDITTPLGLTGTICLGYKNINNFVNIHVAAADSMEMVFNHILTHTGGTIVNYTDGVPMMGTGSLLGDKFDLILAQSEVGGMKEWLLSIQAQLPGFSLFMDASQLTGYNNAVVFQNYVGGAVLPILPPVTKMLTSDIFPSVSNKEVTSKFIIEGFPNALESPYNKYTLGNGSLSFEFKKIKNSTI